MSVYYQTDHGLVILYLHVAKTLKKHLFFDLDSTVTPSRAPIQPHMAERLQKSGRTIVIVSGSTNEQMRKQIGDLPCFQLGQNGNHALAPDGSELWSHTLTDAEKREILQHIDQLRSGIVHAVPDENDLIEDRGSQISFSIYGHNAPPDAKRACDGDFAKRRALLAQFPFNSETIDVQMGGSTCFDYFRRGYNKGSNIQKLIDHTGWNKRECVYFGDALFPGGNDSSVIGVIDTVPVADEEDTYAKLPAYIHSD